MPVCGSNSTCSWSMCVRDAHRIFILCLLELSSRLLKDACLLLQWMLVALELLHHALEPELQWWHLLLQLLHPALLWGEVVLQVGDTGLTGINDSMSILGEKNCIISALYKHSYSGTSGSDVMFDCVYMYYEASAFFMQDHNLLFKSSQSNRYYQSIVNH